MITPSFGLTATERVLPRLALDFTTASLDSRVTFTRALNTATRVNNSGYIEVVNADLPRFDYDPISKICKGLLIEETRSNLWQQSQSFNETVWGKFNSSISATDTELGPDGLLTAETWLINNTTSQHYIQQAASYTSGISYTFSIFAKKNTSSFIQIGATGSAFGTNVWANFDLENGALGSVGSSATSTITNFGDGWYRCTLTGTATTTVAGNSFFAFIQNATSTRLPSYAGNGTDSIYIWGAQLEAGAFPTSYIPTTTTSLTRNADVATMTGTNFSDWYNQTEGSMVCEFVGLDATGVASNTIYTLSDNTTNNRVQNYIFNNNLISLVRVAGAGVNNNAPSYSYSNNVAKSAYGYSAAGNIFAANGNATNTTAQAAPTVDRIYIGSGATGTVANSKYIRKLMYYPQRLTAAEIRAFSK